ncbi:MAG TPA: winged helix-turn-helix domain-containing protein [Terriglobales bacterium]|nr:winged helix-turn-helix domain-containing protein [Terriglobales bacterium]
MAGSVGPPRVAVGDVQLDLEAGVARRKGTRLKLGAQPFQVLRILLSRPNEVVTRGELHTALWPEDVFVDFDHGLNKAINRLRIVLGDSAESPKYIETLPKVGYRWIGGAPVEWQPVAAEGAEPAAERSHRPWVLAAAALVLLAAAGLVWRPPRAAPRSTQPPGWVLITAIENRSGEPVLDGTLEYALERELSNSRFVKVVPRQRIQDGLRLMRRPLDTKLDAALGREVSLRDGDIQALLTGRVEKLGSSYVLSVQVVDPARDVVLAGFSEEDRADTELASAVRRLSSRVREALGETPQQVRESVARLERVTTPSLAALQLYSRANNLMVRSDGQWSGKESAALEDQAAALLKQALAAEPDFASAHLLLAWALVDLKRQRESVPHFRRALELAGTVSEREQLFIQGSYYHITDDWERASQAYESLLALYPDDFWTVNNLVWICVRQQNIRRASELMVRRAELRPRDFHSNFGAWQWLSNHKQRPRARTYYQRALALVNPEVEQEQPGAISELESAPFYEAWIHGDYKAAAAVAEKLRNTARLRSGELRQGTIGALCAEFFLLGQLREAEQWAEMISDPKERALLKVAFPEARGDLPAMRAALLEQVKLKANVGPNTVARLARVGLVQQARNTLPEIVNYQIPADHDFPLGEIALAEGHLAVAATKLSAAARGYREHHVQYEVLVRMALAKTLVRQGKTDEAIRTLTTALEAEDENYKRDARLQLARLYRMQNQPAEAERLEQQVLQSLAYADPDHPLLLELQRRANPR